MRTYRTIVVSGIPIKLYGGPYVFAKGGLDKGTRLLIENLMLPETGAVLDLACGNGIIGIYVALVRKDLEVYMSDINPRALELARLNTRLNGVEDRVHVILSDVYESVPNVLFSAIYSNPPLSAGWDVVRKMICEGPRHLMNNGFMQFVFAKGWEKAIEIGRRCFKEVSIVKSKWGYRLLIFKKDS